MEERTLSKNKRRWKKEKDTCITYTPSDIIISKILHFRFIQLTMYMVFIIDHIYHLMNESKIQTFAYNSDQRRCISHLN